MRSRRRRGLATAYAPTHIAMICDTKGMKKSSPNTKATVEAVRVTGTPGFSAIREAEEGMDDGECAAAGRRLGALALGPAGAGFAAVLFTCAAVTRSPQFPHFADSPGSTSTTCRQLGQVRSTDYFVYPKPGSNATDGLCTGCRCSIRRASTERWAGGRRAAKPCMKQRAGRQREYGRGRLVDPRHRPCSNLWLFEHGFCRYIP